MPTQPRAYVPESWTSQPERIEAARVQPQHRTHRTKNVIALDLLDQMHAEGLPYRDVVTDAGCGLGVDFGADSTSAGWSTWWASPATKRC
jgi:SRSO17 transposase